MPTLPWAIVPIINAFACLFSKRVFARAQVLLIGAILTPGKRTVTNVLRMLGLTHEPHFQNYHRVLNRANWSARRAAGILLRQIVAAFAPDGPVVLDVDETVERRRGAKIKKKSLWHDPVRSSRTIAVFSEGLKWLVMAASVYVPWAGRVWALPFFTVLMHSPKFDQKQNLWHKSLSVLVIQMLAQVRRWLPGRKLVLIGDGSYCVAQLLHWCRERAITVVTRIRWNAALHEPPPERRPKQRGRPPGLGARLPKLSDVLKAEGTVWTCATISDWYGGKARTVEYAKESLELSLPRETLSSLTGAALWKSKGTPAVPVRWVIVRDPAPGAVCAPAALVCTDQETDPQKIIAWFVHRWQIENTFRECREHLGVETGRHWSDSAVERTTPILMGLFSVVTLMAHRLRQQIATAPLVHHAAWYDKKQATFSDALAFVRQHLWRSRLTSETIFGTSNADHDMPEFATRIIGVLTQVLANAA